MKDERLIGLDWIRIGLAALVFLFHSYCQMNCHYPIVDGFVRMGATAMTGFFILSGFVLQRVYGCRDLISASVLKEFFVKRIASLWPAYLFVVFVASLGEILIQREEVWQLGLLLPLDVLGLSTVFTSLRGFSHYGGTWFISCLFLSYLIFPYLSAIIRQMDRKARVKMLILSVFIVLYSPVIAHEFNLATLYSNPFIRGVEFAIGVLLASDMVDDTLAKRSWAGGIVFVTLLAYVVITELAVRCGLFVGDSMMYSWVALPVYMILICICSKWRCTTSKSVRGVVFCSEISYAFFLSQFFCFRCVKLIPYVKDAADVIRVGVALIISIAASVFIYAIVQQPLKKIILGRALNTNR